MKRTQIIALLFAASALPLAGHAANDHDSHMSGGHHAAPAKSPMIEATVKKVDRTKGKVTLSHGAQHGMPAMTMQFDLKNKAWANQIKEGNTILFRSQNVNGVMTVVDFKPAAK